MKRRDFLALSSASAAVSLLPMQASALSSAEAEVLVNSVVADINKVISSGKSLNGMISDFEKIFKRYGDVSFIAGSALGPDARRLSGGQQNSYVSAFTGYISRKYGKRFNEFAGGRIEVNGTKQVKNYYEVNSTAFLPGQSPFAVNFLVSNRTGKNLFFDMVIEGISLRLSEKSEIGAMLDKNRGDLNKLISALKTSG